jgi:hypothetical protein
MQKSRPEQLSGGSFIDGPVEWHRCNHALRIINFSEPRMFEPISPPMRPTGNRTGEGYADIHERARGPWPRFVRLLATIRWEAQFKLAKCCMRASITISDLGVFLAEPVLARSKALNEAGARFRENAPG